MPSWTRLSDAELLKLKFRDLKLKIAGTPLQAYIERLYGELDRAGLKFHPHYWLAEEWFSPDGVPGIAIPFYLSHPRLKRLEWRMMSEVEGGNANWLMRILRHEAGHALDSAFRLRRRQRWEDMFGVPSVPYPDSYRPRPASRRFVQHLGAWYAQSHPTEDFAETFAVWLKPRSNWRRAYRGWPALAKLEYVDELMQEIKGATAPVRRRHAVEPLSREGRTLEEHYRAKLRRYSPRAAHSMDYFIRRVFVEKPRQGRAHRAAVLLRSFKVEERRALADALGVSEYLIHQVIRLIIERCEALDLYVQAPLGPSRERVRRLLKQVTRLHLDGATGRHFL